MAEPLAQMRVVCDVTVLEHVVSSSTKKRPGTVKVYLRAVRSFVEFAGTDPAGWSGSAVEGWRDAMQGHETAAVTINSRLAAVKFASKRFESLGHGPDFARAAEFLPVVHEKKRYAPSFEAGQRLVIACGGTSPSALRDRAIVVLALRTGCRREGIATLQFDALNLVNRTADVLIKGGRVHRVHFDGEVADALRTWCDWLVTRGVTTGNVFRSVRQRVRGWQIGDRLHPSSINGIFRGRGRIAGVRVYPHLARHFFISHAAAAGAPRRRIIATTGHHDERGLRPYLDDVDADVEPVAGYLPPFAR